MMETKFFDGRTTMGPFDSLAALQDVAAERLARPEVLAVTVHKPGSQITQRGKTYELNDRGQWERVGKTRRRDAAR